MKMQHIVLSLTLAPPPPFVGSETVIYERQNYIVVEDFFDIQGLDTLWEAFLRSRATTVVKDAGDLLAQLHLRLKDQSDNQRVWHR